jgi:hypothetical protein
MTDIERLRNLPTRLREFKFASSIGPLHGAGVMEGYRHVADLLEEAGLSALLADYERLRGMEERVKGAETWFVSYASASVMELDIDDTGGRRVLVVPVPGGEGK